MIIACLNDEGKVFSLRQRLSKRVIGGTSASRQFLRRMVGRMSSEQVELLEERISFLTSAEEVGEKELRSGGWVDG